MAESLASILFCPITVYAIFVGVDDIFSRIGGGICPIFNIGALLCPLTNLVDDGQSLCVAVQLDESLCLPEKDICIADNIPVQVTHTEFPHCRILGRDKVAFATILTIGACVAHPVVTISLGGVGFPTDAGATYNKVKTGIYIVVKTILASYDAHRVVVVQEGKTILVGAVGVHEVLAGLEEAATCIFGCRGRAKCIHPRGAVESSAIVVRELNLEDTLYAIVVSNQVEVLEVCQKRVVTFKLFTQRHNLIQNLSIDILNAIICIVFVCTIEKHLCLESLRCILIHTTNLCLEFGKK